MKQYYIISLMILFSLSILSMYQFSSILLMAEAFGTSVFNGHNLNASDHTVLKIEKKINENGIPLNNNLTLGQSKFPVGHDGFFAEHEQRTNLVIEKVIGGLRFPTAFAFLDNGDILFLEKDSGQVRRIFNGTLLPQPVLDINVASSGESGMLGIAVAKNKNTNFSPFVFLYFTESMIIAGENVTLGNRLYRYELTDDYKLMNPKLLLDLPAAPSNIHNGGKVAIGPDGNVYLIVGDESDLIRSGAQNARFPELFGKVKPFDGTSGIFRISPEGKAVKGIISNSSIGEKYFAYGIRNGFGMDFDPLTGTLWDTENGPDWGDEINIVEPGFNSGWSKVQGVWKFGSDFVFPNSDSMTLNPGSLVDFNGTGKYSSPEFTWNKTVGPTAIKFLTSNKLGKQYENDIFVGDINNGNLYYFDLDKNRTALLLNGSLSDKIANNEKEFRPHIFETGLGGITDIEVGPDGYLYFSTIGKKHRVEESSPSSDGSIYRIRPRDN